jgi:hypothetical protein
MVLIIENIEAKKQKFAPLTNIDNKFFLQISKIVQGQLKYLNYL